MNPLKRTMRPPNLSLLFAAMLTIGCASITVPVHAEDDAFICPTDDIKKCDYENESIEIFIKGRDAYDHGREIGDLTEAREAAKKLIARKNKNGKVLMKMIYMQIGMGGHKNYLEAYHWVEEAIANNERYARLDMNGLLEKLSQRMTDAERATLKTK